MTIGVGLFGIVTSYLRRELLKAGDPGEQRLPALAADVAELRPLLRVGDR
jgi:hypothetical protein